MSEEFLGDRKVIEARSLNCQKISLLIYFLNAIFYQIEAVSHALKDSYSVFQIHRICTTQDRTLILGFKLSHLIVHNCNRTDKPAILKDF